MVRKTLLVGGILSSLLYVAMNIFVPPLYNGYNSVTQTISELSAIGVPTRTLWVWLGSLYTLLITGFGYGVWQSAAGNRPLRIAGILLFIYGLISLIIWPFAPMHQREVLAAGGGTIADTMHIIMGALTGLFYMVIIACGAAAFKQWFRFYSIATILLILFSGITMGTHAANLEVNLPTPWMGVWERIMIGIFLLWIIVFAILILRSRKDNDSTISK